MRVIRQILVDLILISVSFLLAYYFRFSGILPIEKGIPPLIKYIIALPVTLVVFSLSLSVMGLYRRRDQIISLDIAGILILGCGIGTLFIMSFSFLYRDFSYSRLVAFSVFIFTIIFLFVARLIERIILRWQYKHGRQRKRVALVEISKLGSKIAHSMTEHPELGYELAGIYSNQSPLENSNAHITNQLDDLIPALERHELDEIYLTASLPRDFVLDVIIKAEANNVDVRMIPDFLEIFTSRFQPELALGVPLLSLRKFPLTPGNRLIKRIFDLLIAIPLLIITLPLSLLIAILVLLTSRGPVFYLQERLGQDGRIFKLMKFRSMYVDAEKATGPVWASANDDRRTPIGRFIRRFSLDELPQILNVIKGDMSLVGPRPERPIFVEQFSSEIPRYLERLRVKSGMTGWAQVNGYRGNTGIEGRLEHDLYYIENWSLWFDIKILLKTLMTIFRSRGAY
jgi:exopolysaccharide biosynthesis polyprenyl glycosylphosphotransferase